LILVAVVDYQEEVLSLEEEVDFQVEEDYPEEVVDYQEEVEVDWDLASDLASVYHQI
jgi:hypothetical protein